jgi:hypothetical protein
MKFNINSDAAVKFTNTLEKLHRSALPNAIRSALNSTAFDVKQNTMPAKAKDEFINRSPNFFKANSRVEMAKGWDLSNMKAIVGFTENGLQGGNNYAVKDLEQQEHGGTIKSKSFIPTDEARGSKSNAKPVRPVNRLSNVKNVVKANKKGAKKSDFVKSAIHAGVGGHVIGNFIKKKLFRIDSIKKSRGAIKIRKTAIYSFEDGRSVQVKATGFMRSASIQSANKMEMFYAIEANKQVKRLQK